MSKTPEKKQKLGFIYIDRSQWYMKFNASAEIASKVGGFGKLIDRSRDVFLLFVDRRYDFDEVVAYMESLNDSQGDKTR